LLFPTSKIEELRDVGAKRNNIFHGVMRVAN
jgi:hypothetical protein